MKRIIFLICAGLMVILSLAGCGTKQEDKPAEDSRIRIVAAIFPAYDWTRNILGSDPANAELTLLLDNGVDLHSYQPSVDDILTISKADLFIYVGGESDRWVSDALKQANAPDMRIIKMLDAIGDSAREEELTEGMQAEEEEEPEEETVYDEHVWLSLRNASLICDAIAAALSELDPANAGTYEANKDAYRQKLDSLDQAYRQAVSEASGRTLLFGGRYPFRYLAEDYGLDCYAAFSGCSAETEASFETITFLARKVDELSLPAVLTIDGTDHRIAETIVKNTESKDQVILTMDSMQSVSSIDIKNGTTYLSVMEKDLEVLKQALPREAD